MPRPRKRALFELGGQWIANLPHSSNLYQFWNDARAGRTRWASLGTTDLGQARLKLAEIVLKGAPKSANAPLSVVLEKYFEEHTDRKPSKGVSRSAGRILLTGMGAAIRVAALTESRQRDFAESLLEQGHKLSYVSRLMTVLAAALRHAKITEPAIIYSESQMIEKWHLSSAPAKKAYIPTDEECARLFNAEMPERLRRFMILSILTGCRPQAAVDLAPSQLNRAAGILDLNPSDRSQNKKYRALVRTPRSLVAILNAWEKMGLGLFGERYCGYSTMEGVKTAIERVREKAAIPRLSTYSFRHKAATILRRARVHEDQIALQLGHRRPGLRTTGGYGEWDPFYLQQASRALDTWFLRVRKLAKNLAKSQANHKLGEVADQHNMASY